MELEPMDWETERMIRMLKEVMVQELGTSPGPTHRMIQWMYEQELIGIQNTNNKSRYRSVNRFLAIREYFRTLRANEGEVNKTKADLAAKYKISEHQVYKDVRKLLGKVD